MASAQIPVNEQFVADGKAHKLGIAFTVSIGGVL